MNSMTEPNEEEIAAALWEAADALLDTLHQNSPAMLAEHAELETGFRNRCYERWKDGLKLLKMFLVISEEFGSTINRRERQGAYDLRDHKFEATVALHARAVRVSNEIRALLLEGFPDGALSRWRTLHELAVVSTFLSKHDEEVSLRFLAHRGISTHKALVQYEEYLPRSNMTPLEPGQLDAAKNHYDELIEKFGLEFTDGMGWAFPVLEKRSINLFDLERSTGLDHWRPRFRWASDDVHASPKPYFSNLGMTERRRDQPALLVGPSNSGFTDPAHMCVISLNLANHAIPNEYHSKDDALVLMAMRRLSDELGDTFLKIDRETGSKSARAMQERAQKEE